MLSVICPVYNEANHIGQVLTFFTTALPENKELIIIDGGSTDETVDIVNKWKNLYPCIRLEHNPGRYVPFALNKAIHLANGNVIVRLDAHTKYASDYLVKILEAFSKSDASIVGGPMRASGTTSFQQAVSSATSTSFGIGNSHFHFEAFEGYTDSVYLGAWKKSVFDLVGYFDEEMLRNQDDEFHYRANKKGLKIYQDPAIRSTYIPRRNYSQLFKQYFEYGLFKPLALKKAAGGFRIRHIIPALFVLYLLLLISGILYPWILIFLLLYLIIDLVFTINSRLPLSVKKHLFIIYPILHFAYGTGFIAGIKKIL
jgi:succinoglycan biosynthesis protein ExoA